MSFLRSRCKSGKSVCLFSRSGVPLSSVSPARRYFGGVNPLIRGVRCAASRVAELGCPMARAARQEIEDVPEGAEIIAGLEAGVGDAQDALAIAPEHGNARQPAAALGAIAH